MNTKWTAHLEKGTKEKEDFANYVKASTPVLNRLIEILEKDLEAVDTDQLDLKAYDSVNWPLKQADAIATKRAYKYIMKLCRIK